MQDNELTPCKFLNKLFLVLNRHLFITEPETFLQHVDDHENLFKWIKERIYWFSASSFTLPESLRKTHTPSQVASQLLWVVKRGRTLDLHLNCAWFTMAPPRDPAPVSNKCVWSHIGAGVSVCGRGWQCKISRSAMNLRLFLALLLARRRPETQFHIFLRRNW